jgi:Flp pilus assembly protein TadG
MPNLRFFRGKKSAGAMRGEKGSTLIEISLLAPWIFFLFVGMVDLGFFSYSLIAVENATRIAAEYTSQSPANATDPSGLACAKVLAELSGLPNVNGLANCSSAPLVMTATSVTGVDSNSAAQVSITYNGLSLFPIPGLLMGKLNLTRTVQMRIQP